MTRPVACASQDALIMVIFSAFGTSYVSGVVFRKCADKKKTRCAAAFNGDETDCAGVLMIVLMTNVLDSVAPKDWKKRKVIDLIESNRIESN